MPGLANALPVTSSSSSRVTIAQSKDSSKIEIWRSRSMPAPIPQQGLVRTVPYPCPRPKQACDSIGDAVKTRHFSGFYAFPDYCSSRSEHEPEPSSACLFAMVNDFIENDHHLDECGRVGMIENGDCRACSSDDSSEEEEDPKSASVTQKLLDALQALVSPSSDLERKLGADICKVVQALDANLDSASNGNGSVSMRSQSKCFRRAAMAHLRSMGYNAAICKSRWDHSSGIPAGDHEYIDVAIEQWDREGEQKRLIVELEFREQFKIVRPSHHYVSMLQKLPVAFVGTVGRAQRIADTMSEAAGQSLKEKGLDLPPWRKPGYLKAKWLSTYKRTSSSNKTRPPRPPRPPLPPSSSNLGGLAAAQSGTRLEPYHQPFPKASKSRPNLGSAGRLTVVISSEWQLPALNPRPPAPRLSRAATGLAAVFTQASLPPERQEQARTAEIH